MNPKIRVWLAFGGVAAVLLGLTACLPIPNTERITPEISGTIRNADGSVIPGLPLGVEQRSWGDGRCLNPSLRATTDSSGRFHFPESTRHHGWILLLGDVVHSYVVCAMQGDSGVAIYQWGNMGNTPRRQPLDCVMSLKPVPHTTCDDGR